MVWLVKCKRRVYLRQSRAEGIGEKKLRIVDWCELVRKEHVLSFVRGFVELSFE